MQNMTEMERIVKMLKDKTLTAADRDKVLHKIEADMAKKKVPVPDEHPKIVLGPSEVHIIYSYGFEVEINIEGEIKWTFDGGVLDDVTATPVIDQREVKLALKHIIKLHKEEYQKLWDHRCELLRNQNSQPKVEEGRLRFVKGDTKKAFVAGMILGKKVL